MTKQYTGILRLPYSSFSSMTLESALASIYSADRVRLFDLKMYDLIVENGKPTSISHGVYVFFSKEGRCLYVGKAGAHFIERIPWHFALHEEAWMNHFIKYARNVQKTKDLGEAAIFAGECELLLIPVEDWDLIAKIEKLLRIFLVPEYNTYSEQYRKRYNDYDRSESIQDMLERM